MRFLSGFTVLLLIFTLSGCAKELDVNRPIEEVKKEAAEMSLKDLEKSAITYGKEIRRRYNEMEKVKYELKGLSPRDVIGEKGKEVKERYNKMSDDVKTFMEHYGVYARQYKELGGDVAKIKY